MIPADEVQCPNCKSNLLFKGRSYLCIKCNAIYPVINGVHIFLPLRIEAFKEAEDTIWQVHPIEGSKEPAWKALRHKVNDIVLFKEIILSKLHFKGKVLEVGAGSCWASALIKKFNPSSKVYATDISIHALLKGREICRLLGSEIDYYVVTDIENLPFQDNLFDAIFGKAILHHLPSPANALKEIWRVLRPRSYYIGEEGMSSHLFAPLCRKITGAEKREHQYGIIENIYSFDDWNEFFRDANFKELVIRIVRSYACWHKYGLTGTFYCAMLNLFPDNFLRRFFPSSILILARKQRIPQNPSEVTCRSKGGARVENINL